VIEVRLLLPGTIKSTPVRCHAEVTDVKDGMCPKCRAAEVYRGPIGWALPGEGELLPTGFSDSVELGEYVCTHCGYVERYVKDPADFKRVAEKYEKIENRSSS
jgi:hypothetical protein